MAEFSKEAIASLAQYYDQPLRCFTFGDFQLSPMVEEFKEILGCLLGGRKPYLFSGFYPSLARISKIVQISAQELDHRKQVENKVVVRDNSGKSSVAVWWVALRVRRACRRRKG